MKRDHRSQLKQMNDQFSSSDTLGAYAIFESLIDELNNEKDYHSIVAVYETPAGRHFGEEHFETAYALAHVGQESEAKAIYERILQWDTENSSVLNNLALIYERSGQLTKAGELISRAKAAAPDDEIIGRNEVRISKALEEFRSKDSVFRAAAENVPDENQFVRDKLESFITSVKSDPDYTDRRIPIPNWKFRVLMRTDETKAASLKQQWIRKDYIRADGKHDGFVTTYEINPYLENRLAEARARVVPKNWMMGIESMSLSHLDDLRYFELRRYLSKVRKEFRDLLIRDFDALIVNHILANHKATIVLAGSLIEGLFLYYCTKKGVAKLEYQRDGKSTIKSVSDAQMSDFLAYFEQNKTFSSHIVHLGNVSRYYRNFVHPGKELREKDSPDISKAQLSFVTACEMIAGIVKPR